MRRKSADIVYAQNMFNKRVVWLPVILVTIAASASSQTLEQTGTVRVVVYVEGTQTPIPGANQTTSVVLTLTSDNATRDKVLYLSAPASK